jgi:hypothetical protein
MSIAKLKLARAVRSLGINADAFTEFLFFYLVVM